MTPERMRERDIHDRILKESEKAGRVCLQPALWDRLWRLLPDRKMTKDGWLPSAPLILAAWSETSDAEKRKRFEYHLYWAYEHGAIDRVAELLAGLKPEDWHMEVK